VSGRPGGTEGLLGAEGPVARALPVAIGDRCDVFASELVNGNRCLRAFFTRSSRHLADIDSCTPGWNRLEARPSRGRSRACPMLGFGQRISQRMGTPTTLRGHVSAYARRGVAMPIGGAQLRSRHDTPHRAPVPVPAPHSPRLLRTAGAERHSSVPLSPALSADCQ
jgi:hypothetical protein